MTSKIIEMSANGRLVIPAETRETLGLRNDASRFEVEIRDGAIVLIPVVAVRVDRTFPITEAAVASAARAAAETGPGLSRSDLVSAMKRQKNSG